MDSSRSVLKLEERRTTPCTSYPFASSNSARYDPSWPVTPVISAVFNSVDSLPGRRTADCPAVSGRDLPHLETVCLGQCGGRYQRDEFDYDVADTHLIRDNLVRTRSA